MEGASPEAHDAIRGKNSFRETVEAIRSFKEHGLTVAIMMTLSRQNKDEIRPLLDLLVDLEADTFAIDRFIPEGQAANHQDWLLPREDLAHCFQAVYDWGISHAKPRVLMYRPLFCLIDSDSRYVNAMYPFGINAQTIQHDVSL